MFSLNRETILLLLVAVAVIGTLYNYREVQALKKMTGAPRPAPKPAPAPAAPKPAPALDTIKEEPETIEKKNE